MTNRHHTLQSLFGSKVEEVAEQVFPLGEVYSKAEPGYLVQT
jgi:hypothetical protein